MPPATILLPIFVIRAAVWRMPPANVSRRTLNDPEHFVVPQFWGTDDHTAWWDLKYLHAYLKVHGWEAMRRKNGSKADLCHKFIRFMENHINQHP